jgi:hypothetical protein
MKTTPKLHLLFEKEHLYIGTSGDVLNLYVYGFKDSTVKPLFNELLGD